MTDFSVKQASTPAIRAGDFLREMILTFAASAFCTILADCRSLGQTFLKSFCTRRSYHPCRSLSTRMMKARINVTMFVMMTGTEFMANP